MDGGPLNWTHWVAGVVSVYASLFGVGKLLFGQGFQALLLLGIAGVCFAWIGLNFRPAVTALAPEIIRPDPARTS